MGRLRHVSCGLVRNNTIVDMAPVQVQRLCVGYESREIGVDKCRVVLPWHGVISKADAIQDVIECRRQMAGDHLRKLLHASPSPAFTSSNSVTSHTLNPRSFSPPTP